MKTTMEKIKAEVRSRKKEVERNLADFIMVKPFGWPP
jgi:hypothetical protein